MTRTFRRMLLALLALALLALPALAEDEADDKLLTRSLTAVGNTERLHRAIEKARNGEQVSIVYLGGSITEGYQAQPVRTKCYAYLSAKLFAEKFMADEKQLLYYNSGISGTPSLLGVTRCEQDVLSHNPDIVFVEFAVNDGTDGQSRLAYESLVYRLVTGESQPAVILLFTMTESGHSAQTHMAQIGSHYDLGMVSVRDAVTAAIDEGTMTWDDYTTDGIHPHTAGHALIAQMIGHYFDEAAAVEPMPFTMPEKARFGIPLATLVNLRQGDAAILSEGSFLFGSLSCYTYKQGWQHLAAKGGTEPLVLEIDAARMTIAYKQQNDQRYGRVEVWVDGKRKTILNGYSASGWGNIVTEWVLLGQSGTHTVEFRMAEGDENKNFYLLDVAYAP